MKKNNPKKGTKQVIYKTDEFESFIELLGDNEIILGTWQRVAEAIGVDKDTITKWKQHPRAKEAIRKGIQSNMQKMLEVGQGDWKMYQSNLKLLGVDTVDKIDVTSDGEKINTIPQGDYAQWLIDRNKVKAKEL